MHAAVAKSFATPDTLRTPPLAEVATVELNGHTVAQLTFAPGWRWAESIKPVAGTDTCQVRHLGVLLSGTLHVVAADGTHAEVGPGSAYAIEPGHDAWVVGDVPVVALEFDSSAASSFATS